jgi:hypothetical protein
MHAFYFVHMFQITSHYRIYDFNKPDVYLDTQASSDPLSIDLFSGSIINQSLVPRRTEPLLSSKP